MPVSLAAQSTIGVQEPVVLPVISPGEADHATLAINDQGDVLVVWHSQTKVAGVPCRQVEGVLLPYQGGLQWEVPAGSGVLLLGDPALALVDTVDTCTKPDVVSVGTNFMVTWPRGQAVGSGPDRLEVVMVEVLPGGIASVLAPSPGEGYVADSNFEKGSGGGMPDLARVGANTGALDRALIAYGHESFASGGGEFEFDLRLVHVDFSAGSPVFDGPHDLVTAVPVDDFPNGGPGGGKLVPDIVEHKNKRYVVAYESYFRAGHQGAVTKEGWMNVMNFQFQTGSGITHLDDARYNAFDPSHRQRRPNLATSLVDGDDGSVSLSWMEFPDGGVGDVNSWHAELNFSGGITIQDLAYPNKPGRDDIHPTVLHADGLRLCFASSEESGSYRMRSWVPGVTSELFELPLMGTDPWRAATDLLDLGTGLPQSRLVPLSYEAVEPVSGVKRIYLILYLV